MNKLNKALDSGIDIFNLSSEFFNDVCFAFSSENGTDVTIQDRKKELKNNCKCNFNNNNNIIIKKKLKMK